MDFRLLRTLSLGLAAALSVAVADASSFAVSDGGRVTKPDGSPMTGPVRVEVRIYRSQSGNDLVPLTLPAIESVPLVDGVFRIDLPLTAADAAEAFNGADAAWLELEVGGVRLPRQRFTATPFALRVPVDGAKLSFDGVLSTAIRDLHRHLVIG
jgi:hypothetical protein